MADEVTNGSALSAIARLGVDPIPGASATGEDCSFETDFDALQAEIEKLDAVSAEPVRWNRVAELAKTLLATKAKDLRVAAYGTVGWLQLQRYAGLADGLQCLEGMVRTHWDGLFPELRRLRGRGAALTWLGERGAKFVTTLEPKGDEAADVRRAAAALETLSKLSHERFGGGEDAPHFGDLARAMQARVGALDAAQADAQRAAEAAAAQASVPGAGAAASSSGSASVAMSVGEPTLNGPDDARRFLADLRPSLRKAADKLFAVDSADPQSYLLRRFAEWHDWIELPPAEKGTTRVPGVEPDIAARILSALDADPPKEALARVEEFLSDHPLWLELQQRACQILAKLGAGHATALAVVKGELAALLARLPGLADLSFASGVPFASDDAKAWIARELAAGTAPPPEPPVRRRVAKAPAVDPLEAVEMQARDLVKAGDLAGALRLFLTAIDGAPTRGARFDGRLALARFCLEQRHAELALPQLDLLDEEVGRFHLEEWDRELCVALLRALLQSHAQLSARGTPGDGAAAQVNAIHARLCRLDPTAVLETARAAAAGRPGAGA